MSIALPLRITPRRRPPNAFARVEQDHRSVACSWQGRRRTGRLRRAREVVVNQDWVLLHYAKHFDRDLKLPELRPDPHWQPKRVDYGPQPRNPTATAAAPKAKAATAKISGQALKAAAEKICGLLDDIRPLVPVYSFSDRNMSFSPDENRKYWQFQY